MKPDVIFEVSWEVCNKVGGIYRVVQSKLRHMISNYGNSYMLIGPYIADKAKGEFIEETPPEHIKNSIDELYSLGARAHFGRWRTLGMPQVILIDVNKCLQLTNDIKRFNWDHFQIDSLFTDFYDYDYPVLWANIVGRFIESFKAHNPEKNIVAHFHEWLSGGALLYLKAKKVKVGCVFTTHATVLGRALAGTNKDLTYLFNSGWNFDDKAREFGIQAKHQTEKASAQNADVFTTVSAITGKEAKLILGREPDIVVENGLDTSTFPTFEEASIKHKFFREKMRFFLMKMFYPYYAINLEKSLSFFVAGRYEFYSKGLNVLIDALGELDRKLRESNAQKTIFVFLFIPAAHEAANKELLTAKSYFDDIMDSFEENRNEIRQRIIYSLFSSRQLPIQKILGDEFYNKFQKIKDIIKKSGNPPVSTHIIANKSDLILSSLRANNLTNSKENKVKVIFYPTYLSGADGLLDLDYFEALLASHLSIFPSMYEPWGYTPLESISLGVPSITTDLSGFGRFIKEKGLDGEGIFVLNFEGRGYKERVEELADTLFKYAQKRRAERIKLKIKAKNTSYSADWGQLVKKYFRAHELALKANAIGKNSIDKNP